MLLTATPKESAIILAVKVLSETDVRLLGWGEGGIFRAHAVVVTREASGFAVWTVAGEGDLLAFLDNEPSAISLATTIARHRRRAVLPDLARAYRRNGLQLAPDVRERGEAPPPPADFARDVRQAPDDEARDLEHARRELRGVDLVDFEAHGGELDDDDGPLTDEVLAEARAVEDRLGPKNVLRFFNGCFVFEPHNGQPVENVDERDLAVLMYVAISDGGATMARVEAAAADIDAVGGAI